MNRQLYADLPQELHEADQILKRYGNWARPKLKYEHCGSAEGRYVPPPNDDDRTPKSEIMSRIELDKIRACLGTLPMMTLMIVNLLYANSTSRIQSQMRKHKMQPHHMRERHIEGVRLFWRAWNAKSCKTATVALTESCLYNSCT